MPVRAATVIKLSSLPMMVNTAVQLDKNQQGQHQNLTPKLLNLN